MSRLINSIMVTALFMGTRKQLLFVDDEVRLLEGLKRLLRKKSKEWDMHFASTGAKALEIVESGNISVIVADMRMPGMDGASVLERVSEISPNTIRFILSGQACRDLVMRVIHHAHIFLAKPCNQELLLSVLERACTLHDLLTHSEIQKMATRMGHLPSIPALYNQLRNELNSDDVSIERIGEIMASDPGMCSKILQMVNSAFFSLPRQVSTAQQAVSILGLDTISSMVLAGEIFNEIDSKLVERFQLENMWGHLNRTSIISKAIAKFEGLQKETVNSAATAGLLHEVGRLVVASNAPEMYQQVLDKVKEDGMEFEEAERDIYQTTSAEIGAYLLGLWGLPNDVIRGVAYHRHPAKDECEGDQITTASIVHVADSFDMSKEQATRPMEDFLDIASLDEKHIVEKLQEWKEVARGALGVQDR